MKLLSLSEHTEDAKRKSSPLVEAMMQFSEITFYSRVLYEELGWLDS